MEKSGSGRIQCKVSVLDNAEVPVSNAMVRLKEKQTTGGGDDEEIGEITLTAASFTAVTDENGIAEFNDVPPGTYSVFVSYEGASTTPQSLTLQSIRNVNCTIQFKKSFN